MATVHKPNPADKRPCHCMITGCFCCYHACDFHDCIVGCNGGGDCVCIRSSACFAAGAKNKGCCLTTDESQGECCKIACLCCDCGLVQPQVFCSSADQCLCFQSVASLPFHDDYVPKSVCALCSIQCAPRCGCCVAPPPSKATKLVKSGNPTTVFQVVSTISDWGSTLSDWSTVISNAVYISSTVRAEPAIDRE